jgi:23S rRNA (cytidine2498-2'-O)-methyltransferase
MSGSVGRFALWSRAAMHVIDSSSTVLLCCRPGMEGDCAAEIVDRAADAGLHGWCRTSAGFVEFTLPAPAELARFAASTEFTRLVFPRQWCALITPRLTLPATDRARPLAREIARRIDACGAVRIEHADSPAGRPLARLARALAHPVQRALEDVGVSTGVAAHRPCMSFWCPVRRRWWVCPSRGMPRPGTAVSRA